MTLCAKYAGDKSRGLKSHYRYTSHDCIRSTAEIAKDAQLAGNELGWGVKPFPDALTSAETLAYACIGGQFQFRLDVGTREITASVRIPSLAKRVNHGERIVHVRALKSGAASKAAVGDGFFKTSSGMASDQKGCECGLDPMEDLVFVAYFVGEAEWLEDQGRLL